MCVIKMITVFLLRINIASHPDVLLARHAILTSIRQSSSLLRGEETRDEAQRTSAWEASINIIGKPKGNLRSFLSLLTPVAIVQQKTKETKEIAKTRSMADAGQQVFV